MIQDIILLVIVLILFGYNIYLNHRLDRHTLILNFMNEHEKLLGKTLIDLMKALGVDEEDKSND